MSYKKTPVAGVTKRKQPAEVKKENRDRVRGVKRAIESELHQRDHDLLFKNCLSFRKYNTIRLAETFESPEETAKRTASKPPSNRIHGRSPENLDFDTTTLLEEAKTWAANEQINWTQLAGHYGVAGPNKGQIVKEFFRVTRYTGCND